MLSINVANIRVNNRSAYMDKSGHGAEYITWSIYHVWYYEPYYLKGFYCSYQNTKSTIHNRRFPKEHRAEKS